MHAGDDLGDGSESVDAVRTASEEAVDQPPYTILIGNYFVVYRRRRRVFISTG